MIESRLLRQLERVAARFRKLRFWQMLAVAWLLTAVSGSILLALNLHQGLYLAYAVPVLCAIAGVAVVLCGWIAASSARNYHWVAQQIETAYPDLSSSLLAAIELRPELPNGRFGFLQDTVIHQALFHAYKHTWGRVVPTHRLALAFASNLLTAVLLVCVLLALAIYAAPRSIAAGSLPVDAEAIAASNLSVTIEPGSTEIERGTSLLVLARFTGPQPADATLVFGDSDAAENRLAMTMSLDDPVFGARIPAVNQPLDYHVEMPGFRSETYHVSVFEYPKLVRGDARLVYPVYTSLDERLIQDVRTISAVEGTELTLICHLNKQVASAKLSEKNAEPIELVAADSESSVYQATFHLESSRRLELQLVDEQGRHNMQTAEFRINVLPNKPPDLKIAFPAHDIDVSPIEETDVRATVWDDFGVTSYGLTYAMAGNEPVDVLLGENAAGKQRHELAHVIRFEELKAEPDQLLSYYFWAEDFGADGGPRRVFGDMYFAEVRPFEEIFRQGQQPPGGQSQQQQQQQQQQAGQNAQQAQQLAELQKEIINATWKLIRRESLGEPTSRLGSDAELIYQSQGSAIEQATSLASELQDPESQAHAAAVLEAMNQAFEQLQAAKDGPAVKPLTPALAAEQAAYQALLRLRAREHEVIRGQQQQQQQQSQSASSAANRAQQQLNQLELSNDENRYETQRTAQEQTQQELQDRETRQVLNRLSELARRQNDLNERLKELQSALEEARTEEQREEIRRQLQRLTEEQQQILRDTDELASRMDSPENQQRMADERQQLEQTRDQVRRASEALEQEMVSQAAAAGTRAEQDFENLRDDFRRQASDRFNEEMREMRNEAQQLDERERELAERLAPEDPNARSNSLRDDSNREQIPEELQQQRQRLEELLDRMRQTITDAEETEPLLSEQLYDTARETQERNLGRALQAAESSVQRGLLDDARAQEEVARDGIRDLRQGIERAAESVLGDGTEALRRAREQLDRLADELNDEIAREQAGDRRQEAGEAPSDSASDERQPGQQRAGQQPRQQQRPGENSPQQAGSQPGQQDSSAQPQDQAADQRGQRGGQQPGKSQANGEQPRGGQQPADRQQPGDNQQPREGQQPSEGQQPGNGQPPQNGQPQDQQQPGQRNQPGGQQPGSPNPQGGGSRNAGDPVGLGAFDPFRGPDDRTVAPLGGEDFLDWSDRLRDVEEMVDDPELRAEASRIRERAREFRIDLKRHSQPPNWDLVRAEVSEPLVELRDRVAEELLRRTAKDAVVPLDRDPVPPKYTDKTRRYYERLGIGQ